MRNLKFEATYNMDIVNSVTDRNTADFSPLFYVPLAIKFSDKKMLVNNSLSLS